NLPSIHPDLTTGVSKENPADQVRRRHVALALLRPLDQQPAGTVVEIAQAEELQLLGISQAIEVEVHRLTERQRVRFEQGVGGALDPAAVARAGEEAAHQRGLACAEVAVKMHHQPRGFGVLAEMAAQGEQRFLIGGVVDAFRLAHVPFPGLTTARSSLMRSPASRPRSPWRAARSPASACASTPAHAASKAASPWARKAAMTPVSASPMPPPAAMPGLPRSQTASRPSGAAMMLPAPVSTATALKRPASARADSRRSRSTSATVTPSNRAASPGCGVSTSPGPSLKGAFASQLRPSASITNGSSCRLSPSRCQVRAAHSSCPSPGPTASTSACARYSGKASASTS